MSELPPEARELTARLRQLYEAAGSPDLATLVRQGRAQQPPVQLNDSTLSGWLTGKSIPARAKEREFSFLVGFLESRVKPGNGYVPAGMAQWRRLHFEASKRSRGGRGGRPGASLRSASPAPARPLYLEQVRRIAPPRLLGRDQELTALAEFCTRDDGSPYQWWQAGPWAGKSALMSTFVMRAPELLPAGVTVVSFFVTARMAGQDNRGAFTTVLIQQLSALLEEDEPPATDEATRDAVLLDLLRRASSARRRAAARLVLLVDGLDEDRSTTHSIAGLLPQQPPDGTRIIVASRANPGVPDDVDDWHPLRDPEIVRQLDVSPHARDLERLSRAEFRQILAGAGVAKTLLGLITAARGGLSGPDLRELSGAGLAEVESVLRTATGRVFAVRASSLGSERRWPDVYLLAHEELHQAAVHYFGEPVLTHYREVLHRWAGTYQPSAETPWPEHVPEYLLSGYPRLLAENQDLARLVALTAHPTRHLRMLDLTGGDAAALAEITMAQDVLLARPDPDLVGIATLSIRRRAIKSRSSTIPVGLPAVWAALGRYRRAEALAFGFVVTRQRIESLAAIAVEAARMGDLEHAKEFADHADVLASGLSRLITGTRVQLVSTAVALEDYERAQRHADSIVRGSDSSIVGNDTWSVVVALAQAGRPELIRSVVSRLANPAARARALAAGVEPLARGGNSEQAEQLALAAEQEALGADNLGPRLYALQAVAEAMALAGQYERAGQIAEKHPVWPSIGRARLLTAMARGAARAGRRDEAERFVAEAEKLASGIALSDLAGQRARLLLGMAEAATEAGLQQWAERLAADAERVAAGMEHVPRREDVLAAAAELAAKMGRWDTADRLVSDVSIRFVRRDALIALARRACDAGRVDLVERYTEAMEFVSDRAAALTDAAGAALRAGDRDGAALLATRAELVARSVVDESLAAHALIDVAGAVARAGEHDYAERLARSNLGAARIAEGLAVVGAQVAKTGHPVHAIRLALEAARTAQTIDSVYLREDAMAPVITAIAWAGQLDRAEQTVADIGDPCRRALALASIAEAAAAKGHVERAAQLIDNALAVVDAATDMSDRERAVAGIVAAVARGGDHDHATRLARGRLANRLVLGLGVTACALARAGESAHALQLASEAEQLARADMSRTGVLSDLVTVAEAMAWAGAHQRAERLADSLADDPFDQAAALARVAEAIGAPAGLRLLGRGFAVGHWALSMRSAAHVLQPASVVAIAKAAYGVDSPTGITAS